MDSCCVYVLTNARAKRLYLPADATLPAVAEKTAHPAAT